MPRNRSKKLRCTLCDPSLRRSHHPERQEGRGRMSHLHLWARLQSRYIRSSARLFCRRPFAINGEGPLISFSFDDFPRSALYVGGAILQRFGLTGTYYASLGLMGQQSPTGTMFLLEDLKTLLDQGHELRSEEHT